LLIQIARFPSTRYGAGPLGKLGAIIAPSLTRGHFATSAIQARYNISMRKQFIILILSLLILNGCVFSGQQAVETITSFEECLKAGNPVMESYPRQCRAGSTAFTEDIGNELAKMDLIRLDSPRPNAEVVSPLKIIGQARGSWFFEASFPVVLEDQNGLAVARGYATATSDWMTENFVGFTAELTFSGQTGAKGRLILKKDNPSGLPEYDDALEAPVYFKK